MSTTPAAQPVIEPEYAPFRVLTLNGSAHLLHDVEGYVDFATRVFEELSEAPVVHPLDLGLWARGDDVGCPSSFTERVRAALGHAPLPMTEGSGADADAPAVKLLIQLLRSVNAVAAAQGEQGAVEQAHLADATPRTERIELSLGDAPFRVRTAVGGGVTTEVHVEQGPAYLRQKDACACHKFALANLTPRRRVALWLHVGFARFLAAEAVADAGGNAWLATAPWDFGTVDSAVIVLEPEQATTETATAAAHCGERHVDVRADVRPGAATWAPPPPPATAPLMRFFCPARRTALVLPGDALTLRHAQRLRRDFPDEFGALYSKPAVSAALAARVRATVHLRAFDSEVAAHAAWQRAEGASEPCDEERDAVHAFIRRAYVVSTDPACRVRASTLAAEVAEGMAVPAARRAGLATRLPSHLLALGLAKKRYSDGAYYYGLAPRWAAVDAPFVEYTELPQYAQYVAHMMQTSSGGARSTTIEYARGTHALHMLMMPGVPHACVTEELDAAKDGWTSVARRGDLLVGLELWATAPGSLRGAALHLQVVKHTVWQLDEGALTEAQRAGTAPVLVPFGERFVVRPKGDDAVEVEGAVPLLAMANSDVRVSVEGSARVGARYVLLHNDVRRTLSRRGTGCLTLGGVRWRLAWGEPDIPSGTLEVDRERPPAASPPAPGAPLVPAFSRLAAVDAPFVEYTELPQYAQYVASMTQTSNCGSRSKIIVHARTTQALHMLMMPGVAHACVTEELDAAKDGWTSVARRGDLLVGLELWATAPGSLRGAALHLQVAKQTVWQLDEGALTEAQRAGTAPVLVPFGERFVVRPKGDVAVEVEGAVPLLPMANSDVRVSVEGSARVGARYVLLHNDVRRTLSRRGTGCLTLGGVRWRLAWSEPDIPSGTLKVDRDELPAASPPAPRAAPEAPAAAAAEEAPAAEPPRDAMAEVRAMQQQLLGMMRELLDARGAAPAAPA
jgi:hypothetical protein